MGNVGYNVAYWNLDERGLEDSGGILYEVQSGERVAFIHFSGIVVDDLNAICKYAARNPIGKALHKKRYTLAERADLAGPFLIYKQLLTDANMQYFSKIPYAYEAYDNGETITQLERSLYLGVARQLESNIDPFSTGRGTFWHACRKAGVRASGGAAVKSPAPEIVKKYGTYMRMIEFFLRSCLRVIG